jgi:hypothetical protein
VKREYPLIPHCLWKSRKYTKVHLIRKSPYMTVLLSSYITKFIAKVQLRWILPLLGSTPGSGIVTYVGRPWIDSTLPVDLALLWNDPLLLKLHLNWHVSTLTFIVASAVSGKSTDAISETLLSSLSRSYVYEFGFTGNRSAAPAVRALALTQFQALVTAERARRWPRYQ